MKIFPEKDYILLVKKGHLFNVSKLKINTLSKEQFMVSWSDQSFIGEIKIDKFELKLSKIIIGEFCILEGKVENEKIILKIRTGKIVKIIFVAIIMIFILELMIAIFRIDFKVIFNITASIVAMRVFLQLVFRFASRKGINKLIEILEIEKIN